MAAYNTTTRHVTAGLTLTNGDLNAYGTDLLTDAPVPPQAAAVIALSTAQDPAPAAETATTAVAGKTSHPPGNARLDGLFSNTTLATAQAAAEPTSPAVQAFGLFGLEHFVVAWAR